MLHYVLMGSEEYHICYQEDLSFCNSPEVSSFSPPKVIPNDKTIGETIKSKGTTTGKESIALNVTAADETILGKETIALNVTAADETIQKHSISGDETLEKEPIQNDHSKLALSTVIPSTTLDASEKLLSTTQVASDAARTTPTMGDQETGKESNEKPWEEYSELKKSYLDAIHEMYPEVNVVRLENHLMFNENWATMRASAALKAFTTVKNMITEKKIVYSTRTSYDEDSDESVASYIQKKPKKTNLDDEDKKFFTSLPTCYSFFFLLIPMIFQ